MDDGRSQQRKWVGVSLRDVLELAGIKPDAVSVLVDGTFSQIWKTLGPIAASGTSCWTSSP